MSEIPPYTYEFLIGGLVGMLWFWIQRGFLKISQENHPFQALIGVFFICGLGTAGVVWLVGLGGFQFR